jgi:hypothetical protein
MVENKRYKIICRESDIKSKIIKKIINIIIIKNINIIMVLIKNKKILKLINLIKKYIFWIRYTIS